MFFREKKEEKKEKIIEKIICDKYNSYYRMAYSHVQNASDAEDIVQEGAYRAMKNSASLKQIQYAETWVYRIMLNEKYRHMSRNKTVGMDDYILEGLETEDHYENIDLKRALEQLQETDRVIIQLKYFEDRKLEEIAEILELNVSTVKSRLYRGLRKLKVDLEEEVS